VDVRLIIDGEQVRAPAGASVLDAARRAGRDVPALCHHEALPAIASCRLCLVEIRRPGRGWTQLTTSCDYPVSEDLEVVTASRALLKHRRMNLQLLRRRAPDAPVLLRLAGQLGAGGPLFPPLEDAPLQDCILCELCVRVCSALGYDALAAAGRGDHKSIGPPFGQAAAAACVGCGSCVEVCPTGCISMVDTAVTRSIWGRTFDLATCERCGRPITTREHAAAMAAGPGLIEKSDQVCDGCRRRELSAHIGSPGG
jgi:NADH dehydrogenase/NADH:ubiquinone oxidoreductase subunit G